MSLIGVKYQGRVRFTHDTGVTVQTYEYELHNMRVRSGAQFARFELINSSLLQLSEPAYLRFELDFVKMRRVTGTGLGPGGDWVDLYNLFLANAAVEFTPFPDLFGSFSIPVYLDQRETEISTFVRGAQRFPRSVALISKGSYTAIPTQFRALEAIAPEVLPS